MTVPPSDTNILRGASGKYLVAPGDVFGRLTVLGEIVGKGYIRCRCICGRETKNRRSLVVRGDTRSCGCLAREVSAVNGRRYAHTKFHPALRARHEAAFRYYDSVVTQHAFAGVVSADLSARRALYAMSWRGKGGGLWNRLAKDPTVSPTLQQLAKTYSSMSKRGTAKKGRGFDHYGGRGIGMWSGWRGDDGFWRWAAYMIMEVGEWPGPGWSLDRIDNDRGYEPGNVRWATRTQQQRNKTNNAYTVYDNKPALIVALAEEHGVHPSTLRGRIMKGWPEEKWFRAPMHGVKP